MSISSAIVSEKREKLERVAKKRFFYTQSFEIYGGVSGFFDYGPHMCALQNNFLSIWRRHFVLEEDMLEVDTAIITPFEVLKSSGHVDKFTDLMCTDTKTGDIMRADHLVRDWLEAHAAEQSAEKRQDMLDKASMIDSFSAEELQSIIQAHQIKSEAGNELGPVVHFNLMFSTLVGPGGKLQSYLRPETAQGQFLNFQRLLEVNGDRMPFASAMVGKAFRNEISPRTGLFRVREFMMAEIEHYVHPKEKAHPKFAECREAKVRLLFRDPGVQKDDAPQTLKEMAIGEAVEKKIVDNETLGYFIVRVHRFLVKIGIPESMVRFRQHLPTEMAHYATDCWDAEISTAFGWIECVGIADRACYDLSVHSKKTGNALVVRRALPAPVQKEVLKFVIDRKDLGMKYRARSQKIISYLESFEVETIQDQVQNGKVEVEIPGEELTLSLEVKKQTVTQHVEEYVPNVIEPSFGIGRILYALLWHSFVIREEAEKRAVFQFKPCMASIKCMVLPLIENAAFHPIIHALKKDVVSQGISCKVDDSKSTIGRRYSKADEVGVPFCVTIDFETLEDRKVTIRDRDSTEQVRVPLSEVPAILHALSEEEKSFSEVKETVAPQ
ncbi:glycyl-tRNA synthetase [Nematocida sp. AWRm77]|nr:glycyl-tRNA synthetase [Nematocida sp. AWRm77]